MNGALWALTAAGVTGLAGWKLGRASGLLAGAVATTRATEAEELLAKTLAAHIDHIAHLERLLDEAGKGAGDEAEAWLEAGGS